MPSSPLEFRWRRITLGAGGVLALAAVTAFVFGNAGLQVSSTPPTRVEPIILYDSIPGNNARERANLMGAQLFYVCYQSADPNAGSTGTIDATKVIETIRAETAGRPPKWGMLDFEDPFIEQLKKGSPTPEWRATLQTMIAAVQAVKVAFPQTRWTYYGIPNVDVWFDGVGWDRLSDESKKSKIDAAIATFGPLIEQLDWVSPTVYGKYDPKLQSPVNATPMLQAERAWRVASVGIARLCAGGKPVIPTIDPFWTPGGKAPFCRLIPRRLFLEEQVVTTLGAGASGVAIWTAIDYFIKIAADGATRTGQIEKDFGPMEWRDALSKDFLGGDSPSDWSSPDVRAALVTGTSDAIARSVSDIKQWTTDGTLPPSQ